MAPDSAQAHASRGAALSLAGRHDEAVHSFDELLRCIRDDALRFMQVLADGRVIRVGEAPGGQDDPGPRKLVSEISNPAGTAWSEYSIARKLTVQSGGMGPNGGCDTTRAPLRLTSSWNGGRV